MAIRGRRIARENIDSPLIGQTATEAVCFSGEPKGAMPKKRIKSE
jgi:hypothetical protein